VLVKGMIDVVILVEGEVGTDTRLVSPRVNPITDEIHHRLERLCSLLLRAAARDSRRSQLRGEPTVERMLTVELRQARS
jgi:hypothetical protein